MDTIKETIETNVISVTVDIPVRVTMVSYENEPFEFTTSIDEIGQIVLTPVSKSVEFVDAYTEREIDTNISVLEQETITTTDGSALTRETSLLIKADMLCESSSQEFTVRVDEIGQVIICPVAKENIFVTATFENSLNLITENMSVKNYFGYTLLNTGDGWDVKDPSGDVIEVGVATEHEAKIVACTTELHRLEELLREDIDTDKEINSESDDVDVDTALDVEAEVIEESLSSEMRQNVILRFLQGDIALFSDSGAPSESYIPLPELHSKGYDYYYDEETDAVVSYPTVD